MAAVAAGTFSLGYLTLFSGFATFDDAGYFLISIKSYSGGLSLYNDVYAEYGPFFFQLMASLYALPGLAMTNDGAVVVTLTLWLATAFVLGLSAYRLSRSLAVAVVVDILAFRVASSVPAEPGTPGHLIIFVLSVMVAVAVLVVPRRPRLAFALLGALAAMLLLTKLNVGGFALAATAYACVFSSVRLLRARPVVWLVAIGFVGLPILLMFRNLLDAGFALYAVHVTLCALAVAFISLSLGSPEVDDGAVRWPAWAGAGAALLTAVSLGIVFLQGTTVGALIHSLVVIAFNQVNASSFSPSFSSSTIPWDALSVAAAVLVARVGAATNPSWRAVAAISRLAAGVAIWVAVVIPAGATALAIPAALTWVAAVPIAGEARTPSARFVRVFLPALAVLQTLHAYPVAGSQRAWSSFLFVIVGAVCVSDGLAEIDRAATAYRASIRVAAALGLLTWATISALVFPLLNARDVYNAGVSFGVPGAARIHVPPDTATAYQGLIAAVRADCSTFISSPGLGSLYVMTGKTPPTLIDGSAWMFAVDEKTQQRAVDAVRNLPGLCAIRSPELERFWARGRPIPERPLYAFIGSDFHTVASPGGYDVMVRNGG